MTPPITLVGPVPAESEAPPVHDEELARQVRRQEEERRRSSPPRPAPRPAPQSEPYGYD